ncbi:MAG: tyrosine-type recombinase/integrase [Acidimicrobiia bacterium]
MAQRGSIEKRVRKGGVVSYRARFRMPLTDEWISDTFPTRNAARSWLTAQLSAAQKKELVRKQPNKVEEYLDEWLEHLEKVVGRRPTTVARYRILIRRHALPVIGRMPVQEVTPSSLDALYTKMAAAGSAPATVLQMHSVLRKAFGDAENKGLIVRNPVSRSSPPSARGGSREMTVWSPEDLNFFLTQTAEHHLAGLWRVAALTGMRRGELCGLRWDCVDLRKGSIRVARTRTTAGKEVVGGEPKTSRGRRIVTLDSETVAALEALRHRVIERDLVSEGRDGDDAFVFLNEATGQPLRPDSVSQAWDRLVATLPLPRLRFHDLRHTHATHLLATGADPVLVSRRLGHANVAFTLSVYGHVLPGRDEQAAADVAKLISDAGLV